MPTYEYRCHTCKALFEQFHLMSENVEKCIKCDSTEIERLLGSFLNTKKIHSSKNKTGEIVKQYIKDIKRDLKTQQREARETKIE